jgi:hypothetical protein
MGLGATPKINERQFDDWVFARTSTPSPQDEEIQNWTLS